MRRNEPWTHCKRGHELSGQNIIVNARGRKTCRTCQNTIHLVNYRKKHGPGAHRPKQKPSLEKIEAKSAVRDALRTGRLKPSPCWVCGLKAEAHHPSYAEDSRLDVVWLCREHHIAAHWAHRLRRSAQSKRMNP